MTLAWHFIRADRMTQFEPRVPIVVGETLTHDGQLRMCESGFHASLRAIDALNYAPGPIACRVEVADYISGTDKLVAHSRKVLWMYDATNLMHEFACCCAETALLIAEVEDPRCWQAIEAKRAWLQGEIDDATLDAAWTAARDAARDAARAAAWTAAWDAAWTADRDAAWTAARDAARDAARAAARAAAWTADRDAAWTAARDAAWDEQNTVLESILHDVGAP